MELSLGQFILLIGIACFVGIITKKFTHLPYTIALVILGIALALFLPLFDLSVDTHKLGFSKDLVFFILLPPLLFQGSLHMQIGRLKRHSLMVTILATIGVVASTIIIGYLTHSMNIFTSLQIAILFGALICTTDPVSVLAIFRQAGVPADLKYLVEGESLFNDGTGVVVFTIVLTIVTGQTEFSLGASMLKFLKVSVGGAVIGIAFGYITYLILKGLTDHLLENAICLVSCYGSFWVAEQFHFSGVIAVVFLGLLIGNYGRQFAMSAKTTETVETFFESIDFIINSLLFILIGLELQFVKDELNRGDWYVIIISIVAVIIGRLIVYPLFFASKSFGGKDSSGKKMKYPNSWSHILFWGGLRGSIPIALILWLKGEPALKDDYHTILVAGFAVVCFSLIVQGITIKPLIKYLKLSDKETKPEEDPAHSQEGLT